MVSRTCERWRLLPPRISGCRLSCEMLLPIAIQPMVVLLASLNSVDSAAAVAAVASALVLAFAALARCQSKSRLLYYWTASSVTYVIIAFENIVVPLSEIDREENYVLLIFTVLSVFFLYLTKTVSERPQLLGDAHDGGTQTDTCPVCRAKSGPRNRHCRVCQVCVENYDYHCYWLNCCVGESNRHFYFVGVLFAMLALGYASLLILTTICEPEFTFGMLLPKDCSDINAALGTFTSFFCGIYCMELAVFLFGQLILQAWLVSTGYSALEWRKQYKCTFFHVSPYSRGFARNWLVFIQKLKRISL